MKLLSVVTPPLEIYHGCSTQKTFWEEKITTVNMTSCGMQNVRKHRYIKNGDQYIILDISYKLDCMDKREFTSSQPNYYMGIPGKGKITPLDLRTEN